MKQTLLKLLEKENVNSLLLTIIFCAPILSFMIDINNCLPITVICVLAISAIVNRKTLFKKRSFNYLLLISFIIFLVMIVYQCIVGKFDNFFIERILYFLGLGMPACLTVKIIVDSSEEGINFKKCIYFLLVIYGIISLILYRTEFWRFTPKERMSISYYLLPFYIGIVLDLFMNWKIGIKKNLIKYVIYIIVFWPLFNFLFVHASRGVFLAIAVTIILCILCNLKNIRQKIILIGVMLIIAITLLIFAENTLGAIKQITDKFNISLSMIDKNLYLLEQGEIGDGRDEIYGNALKGIAEHPILGNGIGRFDFDYGTYPHNLALQLLYEGGIVFLIILLVPIATIFIMLIFGDKTKLENMYLIIFLFGSSIVKLILSYEFWSDLYFWITLYLSYRILYKEIDQEIKIRRIKNGKCNNSNIQKI